MQRDARVYLYSIVESCDAIISKMAGVALDEYKTARRA
jgi:uncharacterized protein with HEPN domain